MPWSNYEPRRPWARPSPITQASILRQLDEEDDRCLSCGSPGVDDDFCGRCRERSQQSLLSPDWDDLGVGD